MVEEWTAEGFFGKRAALAISKEGAQDKEKWSGSTLVGLLRCSVDSWSGKKLSDIRRGRLPKLAPFPCQAFPVVPSLSSMT